MPTDGCRRHLVRGTAARYVAPVGIVWGLLTSLSIGLADLFARRVVNARGALVAGSAMQFVAIFTSLVAVGVVSSEWLGGDLAVGALSGLGMGVGMWGYLGGVQRSSAAVVAPIVATMSAVVPYVYALVRGAEPSSVALVGAAVAVAGLALITAGGGPRTERLAAGIRWGLFASAGYGFGLSVILEASEEGGSWPAVSQRVVAFLLIVGAATAGRTRPVPPVGLRTAAFVAGVLAGCSTIFYLLGIQADPTSTVVTASLFPAVSVVVGRVAFDDEASARQGVGLAVVIVGVIAVAVG